jgi:iron complex transport system substrate-binding protein
LGCGKQDGSQSTTEVRIISLTPHITEILFTLDAGEHVIAVTDFCRFPSEALLREKIGGLLNPNIEKMVALKPTHIFGVPAHADLAAALKRFDLEVMMYPNETIKDVLTSIKLIGSEIGKKTEATRFIRSFNDSLETLSKSTNDSIYAMLVIGREPGTLRNILVAGKETFISELWSLTGGFNLYEDLPSHYNNISIESILTRNPDVIIELTSKDPPGVEHISSDDSWIPLKNVSAVANGHVYRISGNYTMIPGPRMTHLARDFARVIKQVENAKKVLSNTPR